MAKKQIAPKVGSLVTELLASAKHETAKTSPSEDLPVIGKPSIKAWAGYTESVNTNGRIVGTTKWGNSLDVDMASLTAGAWNYLDKSIQAKISADCPNAIGRYGQDIMAMTYLRMGKHSLEEEVKAMNLKAIEKLASKIEGESFKKAETVNKAIGIEQQFLRYVVGQQVDYKTGNPVKREYKEPLSYGQRKTI